MPHPRAKVRTQMPLPWDVLDKQMPRAGPGGGMGTLGFDSCIIVQNFIKFERMAHVKICHFFRCTDKH